MQADSYIGADGKIHRIRPYDPNLRAELKAVSRLVRVSGQLADEGLRTEVKAVTERLASAVIPVAVKASAYRGARVSLVAFLSDGDDFVCGSTDKSFRFLFRTGWDRFRLRARRQ